MLDVVLNASAAANVNGDATSAVGEYKKQAETAAQFGSSAIVRRRATQVPKPKWHAPWKLKRVIAGHLGWVRSIAVDPTNDWFVTGSADRTIKVWDVASGQLKLTLTGHINAIRGLEVSPRHPYLFSAGEDKKVLCWDLEYNKVIRSYHGHLSGVFSLKVHPTLDVLITGGRDAVARVSIFCAGVGLHGEDVLISALVCFALDRCGICERRTRSTCSPATRALCGISRRKRRIHRSSRAPAIARSR